MTVQTITTDTEAIEAWENEGGAYLVTPDKQDRTNEKRGTTMTTTEETAASVRAGLRVRADTYASDARKFRDAGKLGQPIISEDHDARWAACYQVIADELRKAAAAS
jgi:hypothetical protein